MRFLPLLCFILCIHIHLKSAAQATTDCEPGCVSLTVQRFNYKIQPASKPPTPQLPQPPTPELPQPPVPELPQPPVNSDFNYEVPGSDTDWNAYNATVFNGRVVGPTLTQESDVLRIEVRKNYGASLQIFDKVTNQYLINFNDQGRESGMSSYAGPRSFADDSPRWKGIGYNPLQAGDDGGNPSPILAHGIINGWIYTKAQCLSWPHQDARRLPLFYEQWVRLDGNKVHVRVRLTHHRDDKTFYEPEQQEWPMMMINGAKIVRFYNGAAPFTGAPTTATNGIERHNGDEWLLHQGTPFGLTEPWQGVEIANNRMIGMYTPGYYWGSYNVAAPWSYDNSEAGNTITYTSNHPMAHLDSDNTWYKEYTYVVGTEQDVRSFVYAQPRKSVPDFTFNKANGRNGWVIFDGGYDQKEPFLQDNWRVTYTGKADGGPTNARNTKLASGCHSFRTADFSTIYIRMAYSGSQSNLYLYWLLNGQTPNGMDSSFPGQNSIRFPNGIRNGNQFVPIKVINDGKMHTYRVDFKNHPMWKDIVQQFEITHSGETSFVPPGEVVELNYFGVKNPDL